MQELVETIQSPSEGSHMRLRSASVLGGTVIVPAAKWKQRIAT